MADEPVSESASAIDSSEPAWRLEVARRLEAYRARRHPAEPEDSQSPLPFAEEPRVEHLNVPQLRAAFRPPQPSRKPERVEIRVSQPELDFAAHDRSRFHPNSALVPVAGLAERRRAGLLDTLFLLLAYLGFASLFSSLGGHFSLDKMDAIVSAAAFFLFYASYFTLFTFFGGYTPGMQLRRLIVVNADGAPPSFRQLFWRSFGYVVSGGTLLLGFLWSVWDEDHLTWQDRISQTYVTAAAPLLGSNSLDSAPPGQQSLAHK